LYFQKFPIACAVLIFYPFSLLSPVNCQREKYWLQKYKIKNEMKQNIKKVTKLRPWSPSLTMFRRTGGRGAEQEPFSSRGLAFIRKAAMATGV
jgi:hypothetical protein